jgi:cobalt-precorrin 5A hydrolase
MGTNRSFLERAWRGVAVIYTGQTPPVAERIKTYAATMDVPVHYLSNRDVERAFRCYDAVIFIEALGGVVRLICPLLRDKEVDPPVVVADRGGRYFIPLIGAHRGANELAEELAAALGGVAVVTTAVEAARAAPPEELERVLLCRMSREDKLRVAAALRDGREVCVADAAAVPPGYKRGVGCQLTIRRANSCGEGEICCRPLRLYVGLGLTSAATLEEAVEAVRRALRELGADASAVAALASVKPAAAEVAKSLGVPAVVYKPEELKLDWDCLSPPSPKALEVLGVPGAAEPAALTAAGPGAFLLYRKRVLGRVTVAVAAAP